MPKSFADIAANWNGIYDFFLTLFGPWSVYMALLAFLVGTVVWFKKGQRTVMGVIFAPIALALVVSGFGAYPYATRVFLFAAPAVVLSVTMGVMSLWVWAKQEKSHWLNIFAVVFAFGLFVGSLYIDYSRLGSPRVLEEIKPVLSYIQKRRQPGDILYAYYATSQAAFKYYGPRYGWNPGQYRDGVMSRLDWSQYALDLVNLSRNPRVWVVFSHVIVTATFTDGTQMSEEQYFTNTLDAMGKRRDEFHAVGAAAYLYDLSGNAQ